MECLSGFSRCETIDREPLIVLGERVTPYRCSAICMEGEHLVQNATADILDVNQHAMREFAIEQRSRCLGAGHSETVLLSDSPILPFVHICRVRKFLTIAAS